MVQRTVVFPIVLNKEGVEALEETARLYKEAWQYCIDVAWDSEELSAKNLHKKVYAPLKAKLGLKSQYLCSARNRALENVKAVKNLCKKGRKTSKPELKHVPIRLDARTLSFDKPRERASVTTQFGRIKIPLVWHEHALRYRDWDCKAGEIGINRKGKWVLRLVFEKEIIKPARSGKVIGIDRGIKRAVVSSDNRFIGERKWKEHERKLLSCKARLQSAGTPSAKRHLKKLSGRLISLRDFCLKRFKENCDHVVAKEFLSGLQPGDTVVLERLTNIRKRCGEKGKARKKHRADMGRWSFNRVEKAINYGAELHGIYVEYIAPNYTSQTCSKCNIVLKTNRKSQSIYSCSCGLMLNADLNAARNISNKWCIANGYAPGLSVNQPIVASSSNCSRLMAITNSVTSFRL